MAQFERTSQPDMQPSPQTEALRLLTILCSCTESCNTEDKRFSLLASEFWPDHIVKALEDAGYHTPEEVYAGLCRYFIRTNGGNGSNCVLTLRWPEILQTGQQGFHDPRFHDYGDHYFKNK